MKFELLPLAALVLAGCASHPAMVEVEKVVQQSAARAAGIALEPGSVASGGTGYLPRACDQTQAATPGTACK